MAAIRVLIVDDSVVVRRYLSTVLGRDPAVEVIATASSGPLALYKIEALAPDLVTLDLEMEEMDGLEVLRQIRRKHPALPVIVFSSKTERGANAALDALALGANDYVQKPSSLGLVAQPVERATEQLLEKVKLFGSAAPPATSLKPSGATASAVVVEHEAAPKPAAAPVSASARGVLPSTRPIAAVAIGASTGGPNALDTLLGALPADLGVPVLVVQHMPPLFTRYLAERLDRRCALRVHEAEHEMPVRAGHIYIAPGDSHMVLDMGGAGLRVLLNRDEPENSCRPSVDPLFRSVAKVLPGAALGVMLTGMGRDGLEGSRVLHATGAAILAQDKATSVVWGMPGFVVNAGLADAVLPLDEIASAVSRRVQRSIALGRGGVP